MKTLISTFLFPVLLEFFNQQTYLHGLLDDQLLVCILGGFLLGLGIGLVLKAGGSTGNKNVEINVLIANVFHKKQRPIKNKAILIIATHKETEIPV